MSWFWIIYWILIPVIYFGTRRLWGVLQEAKDEVKEGWPLGIKLVTIVSSLLPGVQWTFILLAIVLSIQMLADKNFFDKPQKW